MLIFIWCLIGIHKWFYSGLVNPTEEPSIGFCLKPLPHSEEKDVGKKEDQKYQQSNKKEDNVFAMKVSDVPTVQPHSNMHTIGIVQESEEQCSNDGTKELSIGKEEEGCQNCNWIGAKKPCNL